MGEPGHDIVETLNVLDVDRGGDVDSRIEKFDDILPAFGMAAARRIAMRQLVDQHQIGAARQSPIEIELVEPVALVIDRNPRQHLEGFEQRRRLGAAMRLGHPDQDIAPIDLPPRGVLQHAIGLAHAWRRAEIRGEPSTLLALGNP